MIPVLLLFGLITGFRQSRWWSVLSAAIIWPFLLLVSGTDGGLGALIGGSILAAANTAIGVVVSLGIQQIRDRVAKPTEP